MEFTVRTTKDRMVETARTLRRQPNPPGSWPKGYGSVPAGVCAGRQARQSQPRDASACDPEPGQNPRDGGLRRLALLRCPRGCGHVWLLAGFALATASSAGGKSTSKLAEFGISLEALCGGSAKHSQPTEHKREISDSFFRGTKGHG